MLAPTAHLAQCERIFCQIHAVTGMLQARANARKQHAPMLHIYVTKLICVRDWFVDRTRETSSAALACQARAWWLPRREESDRCRRGSAASRSRAGEPGHKLAFRGLT